MRKIRIFSCRLHAIVNLETWRDQMPIELGSTMQILRPYPNVIAFYDGRIPGVRAYSEEENWLDEGAFTLGCASFAIVDGTEALVYDTHISIAHARIVRKTLEDMGVTSMRVVLSHWHTDHVAGTEVFADCEIISNGLTKKALFDNKTRLETGNPPIKPVYMPTQTFDGETVLSVGSVRVELKQFDIHSHDGTVLLLPQIGVLLAGDTLEDTVTYVAEPKRLAEHLKELERMSKLPFSRILPNHGSVEMIASGGYDKGFIEATRIYVEKLIECMSRPELAELSLRDFAEEALATGAVAYFEPYEPVHRHNVAAVLALREK
jgi:glyoxylase-like metal-dependent hydrolase (beta-lactamase superfamily II)